MSDAITTAVFDTGIVLQAALSDRGPASVALQLMEESRIVVFISPQVREEYDAVLNRVAIRIKNPLLTYERVQEILARIDAKTRVVTVIKSYIQFSRDPNDEPILNLAIQVKADYLVARDQDLLDLGQSADFRLLFPFVKIVDPSVFVKQLTQGIY